MTDAVPSNFLGTQTPVAVEAGVGDTPQLTNGQCVHFVADEGCRAALVTTIYPDDSSGLIDLVFFHHGTWFLTGVAKGEVGVVATWHLPADHDP